MVAQPTKFVSPLVIKDVKTADEVHLDELYSPGAESSSLELGNGARSLFDMSMDVCVKNINSLDDFGSTPFHIVQKLLPYIHRSEQLAVLEEKSPEIRPLCAGRWFDFIKRDVPTWRRYLLQTPKPDGTFRTEKELAVKATGSLYRRCLMRDKRDQAEAEKGLTSANVGNAEAKRQAAPNVLKVSESKRRKPRDKFQQKRWNQIYKGTKTDIFRRPSTILASPDRSKVPQNDTRIVRERLPITVKTSPVAVRHGPSASTPKASTFTSPVNDPGLCKGDDGPIARMVRRNAQMIKKVRAEHKSPQPDEVFKASASPSGSINGSPVASAHSSRAGTPTLDTSPVLTGLGGNSPSRKLSISSIVSSASSSHSPPPTTRPPQPPKRRHRDSVLVPTKRIRK